MMSYKRALQLCAVEAVNVRYFVRIGAPQMAGLCARRCARYFRLMQRASKRPHDQLLAEAQAATKRMLAKGRSNNENA
jgi:hypothetical protein